LQFSGMDISFRLIFAKCSPMLNPMPPTNSVQKIPVQKAFGNYILELRQRTGLEIEQLAERSGFSADRLTAIERGEVNLNLGMLQILVMSLDTTLQDLFSAIAVKLRGRESIRGRLIVFPQHQKSTGKNQQGMGTVEMS
jgi:transcriptional regulator with XRE-family HTH domain